MTTSARRRRGAPKWPHAVEAAVEARLRAMARVFAAYVRRNLLPRVGEFAEQRTDAREIPRSAKASAEGRKLQAAADQAFAPRPVKALSDMAVRRMVAHSKDQFRQLGLSPKKEPEMRPLLSGWAADLAKRVKGATGEQVDKLVEILATGGARSAESIARDVEDRLGVTESRAAFIARDAVGTLNSKVTIARFLASGVDQYVWTTMDDERVRPKHQELDGEVFDADGPGDPEEGHPGEPPLCRCLQYPLAPRDDDQDEE